jgi:hypothetical protein
MCDDYKRRGINVQVCLESSILVVWCGRTLGASLNSEPAYRVTRARGEYLIVFNKATDL